MLLINILIAALSGVRGSLFAPPAYILWVSVLIPFPSRFLGGGSLRHLLNLKNLLNFIC